MISSMTQESKPVILSGFTFARNAIKYDYLLQECLNTLLAICDEVVIAVGESDDETTQLVESIRDPKLKTIITKWDTNLGFKVLSQQTNIAMNQCLGKWGIYLQCDELIHEKYFNILKAEIEHASNDDSIEGLLFQYKHFYASYHLLNTGRQYYRNEIRAIRLGVGIESYNDAKGFMRKGKKILVHGIPVEIYHYGHARNPLIMKTKNYDFHKLWHKENEIKKIVAAQPSPYKIENNYALAEFTGTHPAVMKMRIEQSKWSEMNFQCFQENIKRSSGRYFLRKFLAYVETKTWRIGYNKPYRKLK